MTPFRIFSLSFEAFQLNIVGKREEKPAWVGPIKFLFVAVETTLHRSCSLDYKQQVSS